MATLHVQAMPKETDHRDEVVRFKCLEKPCVDNGVVLWPVDLDRHAGNIHGAEHISMKMN